MCDRPLNLGSNLPSRGVGSNQEGGWGWTEALVDYFSTRMIFWSRRRCLRRLRGCLDRRVTNPVASKRIYALRGLGNPSGEKGLSSRCLYAPRVTEMGSLLLGGAQEIPSQPEMDSSCRWRVACLQASVYFSFWSWLSRPWRGFRSVFFSNGEKKIFECRKMDKSRRQCKGGVVDVLRRKCFLRGSRREFSPSREKIRVVLMTIADGAMSSLTLYKFECSKKCSESWGGLSRLHTTEHE